MTLTIRDAVATDRPALLDLWVAAWRAAMPDIDFAGRREWLDLHLDALAAAGATLLIACDGSDPAGFITVDPATQDVDQLAVALGHQGRGIARALIDAAKAASPRGLRLSVNRDNPRAVALYRTAGFVEIGQAVNARSGLPVLRMAWTPADQSRFDRGRRRAAR